MTIVDFQATSEKVMALLPSLYRSADARPTTADGYLHTLMGLIGEQVAELEDDLADLYDDLFIETCAPWVVPYIGELVGVLPSREIDGDSLTTRAQVAEVIALRRRKGTADVIEELAQAITGWASRVVEMYTVVATTQNLNHRRPQATTVSLRSDHPESVPHGSSALELVDTAFDPFMHSVDVRWIRSGRGRYSTQNLAIFLWSQIDLRFDASDAVEVDPQRFRFHPLGIDTTLVTRRVGDTAVLRAAEIDEVPWPISRRVLDASLTQSVAPGDGPGLYGPGASLLVETADGVVDVADVRVCALGDVGDGSGDWEHVDDVAADHVAVDPQLGRIALGANRSGPVTVSMTQTFTGPIGGGYDHLLPFDLADDPVVVVERDGGAGTHATVAAALADLGGAGGNVLLADSRTYTESPVVALDAGAALRMSADTSTRPMIVADDALRIDCGEGSSIELVGLVIAGALIVTGRPDTVTLRDCAMVPGHRLEPDLTPVHPNRPSVVIHSDADTTPELVLERTITGPILTPAASSVRASDCIIEGGTAGGERPTLRLVAVSDDLSSMPDLGPAPNLLTVLVSGHDPLTVDVTEPATIDELAAALDAVGPDPDVRALRRGARIVVASGADLSIRAGGPDDATAATLGFPGDGARRAVVGRPRTDPPVFDVANPAVGLRVGGVADPIELGLAGPVTTLLEVAAALEDSIRAVGTDAAFADALAVVLDDRLLVVPGAAEQRWTFEGTEADPTSVQVVGLAADFPAIASDGYGDSGPDVVLERVTVLGSARATTATLVTDSILADRFVADRGQEGCIRFSFVAAGSTTPQRYRCVPDHDCTPRLAIASERYGDARYGELVATESMVPVRYGASTGDEMGAFSSFAHRLREQTLTFNLDEFMRFSMEAGLLDGRTTPGG